MAPVTTDEITTRLDDILALLQQLMDKPVQEIHHHYPPAPPAPPMAPLPAVPFPRPWVNPNGTYPPNWTYPPYGNICESNALSNTASADPGRARTEVNVTLHGTQD